MENAILVSNPMKNCYSKSMAQEPLGKWLEQQYLQWQIKNGRASIEEFARLLGLSQPHLSQLMQGRRKSVRRDTALRIAERLGDYEILDILGYARPDPEDVLSRFPPSIREPLLAAYSEWNAELVKRGITTDSPEAEQIVREVLARHGVNLTITR